jgi:hypothetical protein
MTDQRKVSPDVCLWGEDSDGNWETGCHEMFIFTDGGVRDNDFRYCPYCGKKIKTYKQEI